MKTCSTILTISKIPFLIYKTVKNSKSVTIHPTGEAVVKQALSYTAGGNANWSTVMKRNLAIANTTKYALTFRPSNHIMRYTNLQQFENKKKESRKLKRASVRCGTTSSGLIQR